MSRALPAASVDARGEGTNQGTGVGERIAVRLALSGVTVWCGRPARARSQKQARRGQDARTTRLTAFAAALLLVATAASAQVAVRAEVSATRIGLEDQLELEVVIEGRSIDLTEEPAITSLDNLRLASRPSLSTQVSFVNGTVTQSRRYVYVLQPLQVGNAEVGPVRVALSDGPRETAPITVEVVTGSVAPQRRAADPFADVFGPDPFEQMMGRRRQAPAPAGAIAVEAVASRTSLYVGEPLLLTYYLLTQTRVAGVDFEEAPKYQGFWAEELPRSEGAPPGEQVTRNGQPFTRFAVFRRVLFPTKAGTLTIPPAGFRIGLPRQIGFFADPQGVAGQLVQRTSNALEISASPLPDDPDFTGAVGSFRAAATLDRAALAIGEAATLRFKVSGRGNLKWVETAPALRLAGAKVYPPQVKSDLTTSESGVSGSRTWEFVIVPESSGRIEIPALELAYFDPQQRRMERARTAALALTVAPAAQMAAAGGALLPAPVAPAGLRLRSDLDLAGARLPRVAPGLLAVVVLLALAAHATLLGGSAFAGWRRRGAPRPAGRSIRHALAELRRAGAGAMTKEAAALLIERTLVGVFGEIDDRSEGGNEKERALREIVHDVRFVRYAPQLGDYSEKIREAAARAADAVRRWA